MSKAKGNRKGSFPQTSIGPRGHRVTIWEREHSGHVYIRYRYGGQLHKRALNVHPYDSAGRLRPEAVEAANAEQSRVLDCLLRGEDPSLNAPTSRSRGTPITLDHVFAQYVAPNGPTTHVSRAQAERYHRTRDHCLRFFGSHKLLSSLVPAELERFANWRCAEMARSNRPGRAGGRRQAEIELSCIESVIAWFVESHRPAGVIPIPTKRLRRKLRDGRTPTRPAFSEAEVELLERALPGTDPRLALLLSIQLGQRAGQLIDVRRSSVSLPSSWDDPDTQVRIDIPTLSRIKEAGPYYLTAVGKLPRFARR